MRPAYLKVLVRLKFLPSAVMLLAAVSAFAGEGNEPVSAIAIVDFSYVDTSGETRDQRSEHEARLHNFMCALRQDLVAHGRFRLATIAFAADPGRPLDSLSELLTAARDARADILLIGGIQKMSTLVQWAKVQAIEVATGQIVFEKLFTFRGDTDEAWRRAERFISADIARIGSSP
jgi:Protein of unknown function (DUF2380)